MAPSRKRRISESLHVSELTINSSTTSKRRSIGGNSSSQSRKKFHLSIDDYAPRVACERCLTCGEGEQLGHPGRSTTRKPRAIDTFDPAVRFVQACAGGVHSVLLTECGTIYSCGVNEKGTVPVSGIEAEGVTDRFLPIELGPTLGSHGKIVQIAAGASFAAALTEKGSVLAWGNIRDSQGDVTVHTQLAAMQKAPVLIIRHTHFTIVKIAAGENHLVMLSTEGDVLTFGEGSQGQLGRSSRPQLIRSAYMADDSGKHLVVRVTDPPRKLVKFTNVFAGGYWTAAQAEDGRVFACGLNNFAQLGISLPLVEETPAQANGSPAVARGEGNSADYRVEKLTHVKEFDSSHSKWTHMVGVQHLILRNDKDELYGIGKNTDNMLGIGTWTGRGDTEHWRYESLQNIPLPCAAGASAVGASLGCTIVCTADGGAYAFGYDSTGQLGLGLKDDDEKVVPRPQQVHSAHLDGYEVTSVSVADQHAIFLAKKQATG